MLDSTTDQSDTSIGEKAKSTEDILKDMLLCLQNNTLKFHEEFTQMIAVFKTECLGDAKTVIPDELASVVLLNEVSDLSKMLQSNLTNVEHLQKHIMESLIRIVQTVYSGKINEFDSNLISCPQYEFENQSVRVAKIYMDKLRKVVAGFRDFPYKPKPTDDHTTRSVYTLMNDLDTTIKPHINYIIKEYLLTEYSLNKLILAGSQKDQGSALNSLKLEFATFNNPEPKINETPKTPDSFEEQPGVRNVFSEEEWNNKKPTKQSPWELNLVIEDKKDYFTKQGE